MLQLDHELQGCSPSVFYLDGDGEFDAIDIAILEEGNSGSSPIKKQKYRVPACSSRLQGQPLRGLRTLSPNSSPDQIQLCAVDLHFSVTVHSATNPSTCRTHLTLKITTSLLPKISLPFALHLKPAKLNTPCFIGVWFHSGQKKPKLNSR